MFALHLVVPVSLMAGHSQAPHRPAFVSLYRRSRAPQAPGPPTAEVYPVRATAIAG
jgi:hypothetical protein